MLICVTNQKLCVGDYLDRIERLAAGKPYGIMLREKELDQFQYEMLAARVKAICDSKGVRLLISQNVEVSQKIGASNIHLSIPNLRVYSNYVQQFRQVGASVHSVDEAVEAQSLGATYLVAGHIFSTDCKKDLDPRGLTFLKDVCDSVSIPVFGIGGITIDRVKEVFATGASGVCVMSECMTCSDPERLVGRFTV